MAQVRDLPRVRGGGKLTGPLLWLATMTIGLMAGLFFAFSVSVMPGLAKADDRTFIASMQGINRAIQNGAFGSVFFGSFVFTGAAALLQLKEGRRAALRWTIAALGLYVVAVVITMGVNVPLNNKLDAAGDVAAMADAAGVRAAFEDPWNAAHLPRTLACVLALGCLGRSLTLQGRSE